MHKEGVLQRQPSIAILAGSGADLFMPQGGPRSVDQASDMAKVEDRSCVLTNRNATCPAAIKTTEADIAVGVASDGSRYW